MKLQAGMTLYMYVNTGIECGPYILFLIWIYHLCLKLERYVKYIKKNMCGTISNAVNLCVYIYKKLFLYEYYYIKYNIFWGGMNPSSVFGKLYVPY